MPPRSAAVARPAPAPPPSSHGAVRELRAFRWNGRSNQRTITSARLASARPMVVETLVNEFWTSRQRAAHSLHEISYRACFKPQLPRFFVERFTKPGDVVYDPFMGRGTTVIEAALLGRSPIGCDVSSLSAILAGPRLAPPTLHDIHARLNELDLSAASRYPSELEVFYHPETLREICALKDYLIRREHAGTIDAIDRWIRMVAVNRLTGHSSGFFSVYTLPPNQATSLDAQAKINAARKQTPPRRDVLALIATKSQSLLSDCDSACRTALLRSTQRARLLTKRANATPEIRTGSVDLVVTSPPFLDVVDYAGDNWLRCWFCGLDSSTVELSIHKKLPEWQQAMRDVFRELARVLRPGGHVAFEVGEIRSGKIKLEEAVLPCGLAAGLTPVLVVINSQQFTKTANCWGISNNKKGTNSNRIVLFRKERGTLVRAPSRGWGPAPLNKESGQR